MDLEADGTCRIWVDGSLSGTGKATVDVKDLQSDMFPGSTSHGITDDWGAYVRLAFWHRLGMEVSIIRRTAQTHNMGRMCVKGCE
jgi:hypothetical protein